MKFVRYEYKKDIHLGILDGLSVKKIKDFTSIYDIINKEFELTDLCLDLDQVKVLAPIVNSKRNLFCLGKNYKEHALEMKGKITEEVVIPSHPIYFSKVGSSVIGDGDIITGHQGLSEQVDYEVELAIIISKEGRNIKTDQVRDYIFGYTICNDISARDLQKEHYQWLKGKSLDGFCPMGPIIVSFDEIPYPPDLKIQSFVNGELRQDSRTSQLIFDIDTIVSDLSKGMTLYPGDIILTGTPSGVGMGYNPPKYLTSGDVIRCSIESIGQLTNTLK